jgi:ketosteroid isomerase-like protein
VVGKEDFKFKLTFNQYIHMSNVDVIKNAYEAFGRGDVPAVLGAMDPEIEWHEAEGNPYMPSWQ